MGHYEACARHLANIRTDPNAKHDDGFTPLMTAAEAGHAQVVALLGDDHRCNPATRNAYGQTALHFAAQNGLVGAASALLDSRQGRAAAAQLLLATSGGCTAAEKARRAGYAALADDLAARASEHHLSRLLRELTSPALGLRWVRCAGDRPPSTNPADELRDEQDELLRDALTTKPVFTEEELSALGVDRTRIHADCYVYNRRGECYAPMAGSGHASGRFDSLHARLSALCKAVAVPLPGLREPGETIAAGSLLDDDDYIPQIDDGQPTCCICLSAHVDTALTPCFHAAFCAGCAASLVAKGTRCPIGRCAVRNTQRIYL